MNDCPLPESKKIEHAIRPKPKQNGIAMICSRETCKKSKTETFKPKNKTAINKVTKHLRATLGKSNVETYTSDLNGDLGREIIVSHVPSITAVFRFRNGPSKK